MEGVGEVDAALRAAVKQALGTAAVDSDDEVCNTDIKSS